MNQDLMRSLVTLCVTGAISIGATALAQGPGGGGRGQGGGPPAPPVLTAIDANADGEISAEEIESASKTLTGLDANKDGELDAAETAPVGGFGGRGGGPGGRGGGGRGGRGGGPGGRGGRGGGGPTGEAAITPDQLEFKDGVANIKDMEMFHELAYKGDEVAIDWFLAGLEFVKFTYHHPIGDKPQLFIMNTKSWRAHPMFGDNFGIPVSGGTDQMRGVIVYRPMLKSPSGNAGLFTVEFEPEDAYTFELVKNCIDMLVAHIPFLEGNIGYYPRGDAALAQVAADKDKFAQAKLSFYRDEDLNSADVAYLPLNPGETFGRLRLMKDAERPGVRDVAIYQALPNDIPRVAGIVTTVRQTPLSHVNLRAVQDKAPNSFIANAAEDKNIKPLLDKYVAYKVTANGYTIREASLDEVEKHFASMRPAAPQVPTRDLSVKTIRPLDKVEFKDATNVGVKAANVAAMRKFGLPEGAIPDGFAVPFYFYDEFMKANDFYKEAAAMMAKPEFRANADTREKDLERFQSVIEKGKTPDWMADALDSLQKQFPEGVSIRCRSSTNNEDLPGFSGAGLYDSYTHKPDEGKLSKTIRKVYASLWNFRAFEERDFYKVDHMATAMGVLVHANFKGERANGVAVTDDILYGNEGAYYVNSQMGEDLVTNPQVASTPEETVLNWTKEGGFRVIKASNKAEPGKSILAPADLDTMRDHLAMIHARFARLYGKTMDDERFAMEVEFKVDANGVLSIKQARPWVFAEPAATQNGNEVAR